MSIRINEAAAAYLQNPLSAERKSLTMESAVADMRVRNINCVYSLIRALNSDRLTRNITFYPRETIIGKPNEESDPTGFASFVRPHGRPIIKEHRLQDSSGLFGDGKEADTPMGRIVLSAYVKNEKDPTPHPKAAKGYPGFVEGTGYLRLVAAISDEREIPKVLGGAYHTVSVGSDVEQVIESTTGVDLVEAMRSGKDGPKRDRGQIYEGKLSYLIMRGQRGRECSFVNSPSDTLAAVEDPDIGAYGLQTLLAQKKIGNSKTREYTLFDAQTLSPVMDYCEGETSEQSNALITESVWDTTYDWEDSTLMAESVHLVQGGNTAPMASIEDTGAENKTMAENKNETNTPTADALETARKLVENSKILDRQKLIVDDAFVAGTGESTICVQNAEVFQELSNEAVALFGEWTVESAKYALITYLIAGETVTVQNKGSEKVTAGAAYGLEEAHELYAVETDMTWDEFNALEADSFKGPDRTQPSFSPESELLRARVMGTWTGLPLIEYEDGSAHTLIKEEEVSNTDTITHASEWLKEAVGLELNVEGAGKCLELASVDLKQGIPLKTRTEFTPAVLKYEHVRKLLTDQNDIQSESSKYLRTLVGVCRKFKIRQSDIQAAGEAYLVFGDKVLEKLLASISDEVQHATEAESDEGGAPETEESAPIQVEANAIAAQEASEDAGSKDSKSTKSVTWKDSIPFTKTGSSKRRKVN